MNNVKGLVNIIKKKVDTDETTFESGWKENLVFDSFFTNYQPGAYVTGQSATNPANDELNDDPEDLMYSSQDRDRGGLFYLYATDTYVANFSPSCNSLPGTMYLPQSIAGTPHMILQGDGGATATTELKMTQQLLPPTTGTRTLHTFGLNAYGVSGSQSGSQFWTGQQVPLTGVSFASAVTQDTTEVVVILYRLQFPYSTSSTKSLNNYIHFAHNLVGRNSTTFSGRVGAYNDFTTGLYYEILGGKGRYSFWGNPDRGRIPNSLYVAGKPNSEAVYLNGSISAWKNESDVNWVGWDGIWHGSYKMKSTDTDVGAFRGSWHRTNSTTEEASGSSYPIHNWGPILPPGADKTQQYFGKISNATVPFFDAGEVPNTDGTIVVDTSSYNTTFPEQWKVDISGTTGNVGVPEYSFMKRYTLGWTNNTLVPRFEPIITGTLTSHVSTVTTEFSTMTEPNPERIRGEYAENGNAVQNSQLHSMDFSDPSKLFTYDNTTITFIKADKPYSIAYGSFYDPTFAPTALGQVEYDELSDTLWLSCYGTGIYSIQDPFGTPTFTSYDLSTVTDVSATVQNNCYAITVGTQSGANSYRVIWAFMEGALVKSTDNGATWTGYDSTSTGGTTFVNATIEATWSAAHVIKADRNNANRLLYLFDPSPNSNSPGQLAGNVYYGKYKGEWWSPTTGATNVLTTSGDLPILYGGSSNATKDIGWFFRTSGNNGLRAQWLADGNYAPVRRYSQHLIGCTPRESNWYFSQFYLDRLGLSGTYNTAPLEIFWEQQIGGSPANYSEFTVGDTFDEKWVNDSSQYAYQYEGNGIGIGTGNFSDTYNVNSAWMYTHILDRNDDGHECLVQSNGRNNNIHMFEFNGSRVTLLGAFGTGTDGGISSGTYYNRYIGRGLVVMNSFAGAMSDGTTFLGIDPAKKLVGDIWQRYKWNGSSWILRQDDNDALTVKTTHSSTDALIGGATISFDDAGATQSFESGEAISFHVYRGLLNDAGTNCNLHAPDISYWDSERVTEVTGATIALNTPSDLIPEIYYDSVGEYEGTTDPSPILNTSNPEYYEEDSYNIWGAQVVNNQTTFYRLRRGHRYSTKFYPCSLWYGGTTNGATNSTWNGSESTPGQFRNAIRKKTTLAAAGDFEVEFQLLKHLNFDWRSTTQVNDIIVYTDVSGLLEANAYVGVVNSASFSDTSPISNPYSINDFDYGFRIRFGGPAVTSASLNSTSAAPNYNWQNEVNKSDFYLPVTDTTGAGPTVYNLIIEVIESGSVVYTHTDTEFWYSIFNTHTWDTSLSSRVDALNTVDTWNSSWNAIANDARYGMSDPVNARRCPFTIKRVGTTITYYLRDQLIYTSAASSSESLIPAQLHEVISKTQQGANGHTEYGLGTANIFKKSAANDYWVRVGTSGSGNASFNSNFLYMQMAFREAFSIKIDGVEATVTGIEDNGTLSAGEVSVFPRQGLIRCAAADAGKTITVSIPCAYR